MGHVSGNYATHRSLSGCPYATREMVQAHHVEQKYALLIVYVVILRPKVFMDVHMLRPKVFMDVQILFKNIFYCIDIKKKDSDVIKCASFALSVLL